MKADKERIKNLQVFDSNCVDGWQKYVLPQTFHHSMVVPSLQGVVRRGQEQSKQMIAIYGKQEV